MEEEIEVAESVMFSGLKIEQEFSQRLTIRDANHKVCLIGVLLYISLLAQGRCMAQYCGVQ